MTVGYFTRTAHILEKTGSSTHPSIFVASFEKKDKKKDKKKDRKNDTLFSKIKVAFFKVL